MAYDPRAAAQTKLLVPENTEEILRSEPLAPLNLTSQLAGAAGTFYSCRAAAKKRRRAMS